jgi:Lrp/AsnC family leucine-responsive transcriptional regulator
MKNLDLYDLKILYELDKNSRKSASEIAKKVRLSKVSVNQRIKKLKEKNIIKTFMTHINYRKIGYNIYHIFYKLQNLPSEKEKTFYSYLINNKSIGCVAKIDGNFDTLIVILAKNNEDLDLTLSEINHKFGLYIKERKILPVINAQYFGRRYLIKEKELIQPTLRKKPEKIIKLNNTDHKLLQSLTQNARIPIIDLSKKLNISKDIAHYRIKKLIKENILQKFTINLNHEKFGNSFFKILITLNYKSNEKEFLSKISNYKNIIRTIRLLGVWDIELDFEVNDNKEMRKIIKKLKEQLGNFIQDYDSLFIYEIDKLNYYPFA